jgi:hypothetical protein
MIGLSLTAFAVLWFFSRIFKGYGLPQGLLRVSVDGLLAVLILYYVLNYTKTSLWFKAAMICLLSVMLIRSFGYWIPFINALGGIQFNIGSQKMTLLVKEKACPIRNPTREKGRTHGHNIGCHQRSKPSSSCSSINAINDLS